MDITTTPTNGTNISTTNGNNRYRDGSNINFEQFKSAFNRVFGDGIHDDTLNEIFNGFIISTPSSYTAHNSTLDYLSLLKDPRLKRILLIVHHYAMSSLTELHYDYNQRQLVVCTYILLDTFA